MSFANSSFRSPSFPEGVDALIPTVLDTDPGIDDALALLLAFGSPELDVLALTVVAGTRRSPATHE